MRIQSPDDTISVASENLLDRKMHIPIVTNIDVLLKVSSI